MLNKEDYDLAAKVVKRWGEVQTENKEHRALVTEDEWNFWEGFNKDVSKKLLTIINNFNNQLEPSDREYLESILQLIASSKRLSYQELWLRKIDTESDEDMKAELRNSFTHS